MVTSRKFERSLLSHKEYEELSRTHVPEIASLDDASLMALQRRVRELRARDRTLVREIRRGISGKKEPRGSSFPGTEDRPSQRKQLFSSALKRISGEVSKRRGRAARSAMRSSLEQAMDRRKRQAPRFLDPGRTSHEGMTPLESAKTVSPLERSNVGRASQTTKVAQAKKDQK